MSKVVLFGAGVYAKKYKALLEYLHMDFDCFTDNDSSKWGSFLYGKPVIPPEELKNFPECRIIISSTHEIAIRKQLSRMGLSGNVVGLDDLYEMCEQHMSNYKVPEAIVRDEETIVIDMYEGIGWGGTELWAANLAYGLQKEGKRVILLGGTEQPNLEKEYEILTTRISEQKTISQMIEVIEKNLPCVFINNFAGCAFMAAAIVRRYSDSVRIISVVHNDNKSLFDAHMMLSKYIDKIFCVSNQIREHMLLLYDYEQGRYYFKEQPIEADKSWERVFNDKGVLRIGYAARLVKQQKRADLLVDFIDCLEKKGFPYLFQIAGEGECAEQTGRYIIEKHLEDRVQLIGRLPKSEMPSFWKNQDIYINISEYEGTSLSMLEAMSYGCVPVVTDVSGAREFIEVDKNGYICDVGDLQSMVDFIGKLDVARERLRCFGRQSQRVVQMRCDAKEYIKYWEEKLLEIQ